MDLSMIAFTRGKEGVLPMAYWLFKSEPSTWSWDDQMAKGESGEEWDGVRNYQARNYMRAMKVGDRGVLLPFPRQRRPLSALSKSLPESHQDSTTDDRRWDCVDIKAVGPVSTPVTLQMCRNEARLSGMVLVNNTRLSVQPVTQDEWDVVCELARVDPRSGIWL